MTLHRRTPSHPGRALWAVLVILALFAGACGDDGTVDDALDGGSTGDDTNVESGSTDIYLSSDFATVCRGVGLEGASPYVAGDGRPLVIALTGETPEFSQMSGLPDGWEPDFESYADTELVACLDRTAAVSDQVCDGYEDEGLSWSVEAFSATYDVTLRDAQTAEVIEETVFEAPSDGCPMFSFYSEGDPSPKPSYPSTTDALEAFLAPYINA